MLAFYIINATQIFVADGAHPLLHKDFFQIVEGAFKNWPFSLLADKEVYFFGQDGETDSKTDSQQHMESVESADRTFDELQHFLFIGEDHLGSIADYLLSFFYKITQDGTVVTLRDIKLKYFLGLIELGQLQILYLFLGEPEEGIDEILDPAEPGIFHFHDSSSHYGGLVCFVDVDHFILAFQFQVAWLGYSQQPFLEHCVVKFTLVQARVDDVDGRIQDGMAGFSCEELPQTQKLLQVAIIELKFGNDLFG